MTNNSPSAFTKNRVQFLFFLILVFLIGGNTSRPYFKCENGTELSLHELCLLEEACLPSVDLTKFCQRVFQERFRCLQYDISIPHYLVCDGISHCQLDGSDENPNICGYRSCPQNKYYCATYGCVDISKPCLNTTDEGENMVLSYSDRLTKSLANENRNRIRCGRSSVVPLILHGSIAKKEDWPWHVSLYTIEKKEKWDMFCGGSLISSKIVITAGHCIWAKKPYSIKAALGKALTDFELKEYSTQIRDVHKIIPHPLYHDASGNYASDIAILVLKSSVTFTEFVRPVCMDWKFKDVLQEVKLPTVGFVPGMGITENETTSEQLRSTTVLIVDTKECLDNEHFDFKRYVTFTSFCAGWINGSSVCNGDSGGGLVIETNGLWQLEGIVSVSPKRPNTFLCDNRFYVLFTKVGMYTDWIRKTMISEGVGSSFFL